MTETMTTRDASAGVLTPEDWAERHWKAARDHLIAFTSNVPTDDDPHGSAAQ